MSEQGTATEKVETVAWAIVERSGGVIIAGRISEQQVLDVMMIRVEVPMLEHGAFKWEPYLIASREIAAIRITDEKTVMSECARSIYPYSVLPGSFEVVSAAPATPAPKPPALKPAKKVPNRVGKRR